MRTAWRRETSEKRTTSTKEKELLADDGNKTEMKERNHGHPQP